MKSKILSIDGHKITIKEVRPKDVANILANTKEIFGDPNLDVMAFINEKYDLVIELTKPFIVTPDDFSIDELGFSDFELIIEGFKEVNDSFLERALPMMQGVLIGADPQPPKKKKVTTKN